MDQVEVTQRRAAPCGTRRCSFPSRFAQRVRCQIQHSHCQVAAKPLVVSEGRRYLRKSLGYIHARKVHGMAILMDRSRYCSYVRGPSAACLAAAWASLGGISHVCIIPLTSTSSSASSLAIPVVPYPIVWFVSFFLRILPWVFQIINGVIIIIVKDFFTIIRFFGI